MSLPSSSTPGIGYTTSMKVAQDKPCALETSSSSAPRANNVKERFFAFLIYADSVVMLKNLKSFKELAKFMKCRGAQRYKRGGEDTFLIQGCEGHTAYMVYFTKYCTSAEAGEIWRGTRPLRARMDK